jgi:transcriptional regulator with PAS, ATPase and Fis domain
MDALIPLARHPDFARMLMAEIPWGILILDEDGRSHPANDILRRTFGLNPETKVRADDSWAFLEGGENARGPQTISPKDAAENEALQLGLAAIRRNRRLRSRGRIRFWAGRRVREAPVLFTAVPMAHEGRRFAAVIFQDIGDPKQMTAAPGKEGFQGIIGRERAMRKLFDAIRTVAPTPAPVLIQGESGTGKELVAQAIHRESPRAESHFVPFNCGALPDGLIESELFGHVKGAFTGAIRDKKGRFELAHGGTLFLDEIGELKPDLQVKLLRVLEAGRLERVGGETTLSVDVRVISATNRNLEEEVSRKRFREDLYYRLCVMPIFTPPLRDRRGDIPLLVRFFLSRFNEQDGFSASDVSEEALHLLGEHSWPGNVRELQNAVQYALVQSRGEMINPGHLPPSIRWPTELYGIRKRDAGLTGVRVRQALREAEGNKKRAAQVLGVSRSTLYRFLSRNS